MRIVRIAKFTYVLFKNFLIRIGDRKFQNF